MWVRAVLVLCSMLLVACATAPPADEMAPLTSTPGDATKGRTVVADRRVGLCLLCHPAPITEERFQGNLAPDLAGVGSRYSTAQLRLRVVNSKRLNPDSIMPAYLHTDSLNQVGSTWAGKSILTPQQIEDVVAYLETLK
jgi:L-cysteine S-thiosulfotransferase